MSDAEAKRMLLTTLHELLDGWRGVISCDMYGKNEYVDLSDPDTHGLLSMWPAKIERARAVLAKIEP